MSKFEITTQRIANHMSRVLNEWLQPSEMEEIRKRNDTPEYGDNSCASHDFCDANMAMAEAFETVCKREINLQSDADISKWNDAWEIAKANKFHYVDGYEKHATHIGLWGIEATKKDYPEDF